MASLESLLKWQLKHFLFDMIVHFILHSRHKIGLFVMNELLKLGFQAKCIAFRLSYLNLSTLMYQSLWSNACDVLVYLGRDCLLVYKKQWVN